MKITARAVSLDSERNKKPGLRDDEVEGYARATRGSEGQAGEGKQRREAAGGGGRSHDYTSNPLLREHAALVVARRGHACRPAISITLITTPTAATIL